MVSASEGITKSLYLKKLGPFDTEVKEDGFKGELEEIICIYPSCIPHMHAYTQLKPTFKEEQTTTIKSCIY